MSSSLFNRRIVVTRSNEDNAILAESLRKRGAIPVEIPTIEIRHFPSPVVLPAPLMGLADDDWLIFTSANAVNVFFRWRVVKSRLPFSCRLACVGTQTANSLQTFGHRVDFVPASFTARDLADEIPEVDQKRVIWLGPQVRNNRLELTLKSRGAEVHFVPTYETIQCPLTSEAINQLRIGVDAITFASPSAVDSIMSQADNLTLEKISGVPVVCIGPVTAASAKERGLNVVAVPTTHDVISLVDALDHYFSTHPQRI
jgi:uroporphyrinogen-III synthase